MRLFFLARQQPATLSSSSSLLTTIPVAFHVITGSGGAGDVPLSSLLRQLDILQSAFSANMSRADSGIRFRLDSVTRHQNAKWFTGCASSGVERDMKTHTAKDPTHTLNVWTCKPGVLGWANLPTYYPESSPLHGVVVHYQTLPGGSFLLYNRGFTLVHEVGHYLGLLHTFQGGCAKPGDGIPDTPAEALAYQGSDCKNPPDTCPTRPGRDPIRNFMDYSADECLTHFTKDQVAYMRHVLKTWRPGLLGGGGGGGGGIGCQGGGCRQFKTRKRCLLTQTRCECRWKRKRGCRKQNST